MVEISPLTSSDRGDWETLARGFKTHFGTPTSDQDYDRTWQRLLDDQEIHGIAARLNGTMVGIAHYYFHTSVWSGGKCYLADLFVDREVRRKGVATAIIERVAHEATKHGAVLLHWHTTQDNAAGRALYDRVASFHGHITYTRTLGPGLTPPRR